MFNPIKIVTSTAKKVLKSQGTEAIDQEYGKLLMAFRAQYPVREGWIIRAEDFAHCTDEYSIDGGLLSASIIKIDNAGKEVVYSSVSASFISSKHDETERCAVMEAIYRLGVFNTETEETVAE